MVLRHLALLWLGLLALTILLLTLRLEALILASTLGASLFYYYLDYCRRGCTSPRIFVLRLLRRELPHQLIYMIWLFLQSRRVLILYIPLSLSTAGKVCEMAMANVAAKNKTLGLVEELLFLQAMSEMVVLAETVLRLGCDGRWAAARLLFLGMSMKIKLGTTWSFGYSLTKLNLLIRRKLNKRKALQTLYQTVYRLARWIGGEYSQEAVELY